MPANQAHTLPFGVDPSSFQFPIEYREIAAQRLTGTGLAAIRPKECCHCITPLPFPSES
jgi:hypothetical protein